MTNDINMIIIMGNITNEPTLKEFGTNKFLTKFGIASNDTEYDNQTKQYKKTTIFIDVELWGDKAKRLFPYLKKGKNVHIEGHLKLNTWNTPEGKTIERHVIVANKLTFINNTTENEPTPVDNELSFP